jgi:hypothetical protein
MPGDMLKTIAVQKIAVQTIVVQKIAVQTIVVQKVLPDTPASFHKTQRTTAPNASSLS